MSSPPACSRRLLQQSTNASASLAPPAPPAACSHSCYTTTSPSTCPYLAHPYLDWADPDPATTKAPAKQLHAYWVSDITVGLSTFTFGSDPNNALLFVDAVSLACFLRLQQGSSVDLARLPLAGGDGPTEVASSYDAATGTCSLDADAAQYNYGAWLGEQIALKLDVILSALTLDMRAVRCGAGAVRGRHAFIAWATRTCMRACTDFPRDLSDRAASVAYMAAGEPACMHVLS